jgi:superfamily II DNA or RNA helicase
MLPPFICPVELRDYQIEAADYLLTVDSCVTCMPTGTGKSFTIFEFIRRAYLQDYSRRFLIIVPRKKLKQQLKETRRLFGFNADVVQISLFVSVANRLAEYSLDDFWAIISDECHLIRAKKPEQVLNFFKARSYGFSATPERLDGLALNTIYPEVYTPRSKAWYVEQGYNAPIRILSRPLSDSVSATDDLNIQASKLDKTVITGDAVKHWLEHAKDLSTIVFCTNIEHADHVADQYNESLHSIYGRDVAVSCHSKKSDRFLDQALEDIESGEKLFLVNSDLYIFGLDIPRLKCLQFLRLTKSYAFYNQMQGRIRRVWNSQDAIMLDHVGNFLEHGHPDLERVYTLEGKETKKQQNQTDPMCCNDKMSLVGIYYYCAYCGSNMPRKKAQKLDLNSLFPEVENGTLIKYSGNPDVLQAAKIVQDFKTKRNKEGKAYKAGWMVWQLRDCYSTNPDFSTEAATLMLKAAGYNDSVIPFMIMQAHNHSIFGGN